MDKYRKPVMLEKQMQSLWNSFPNEEFHHRHYEILNMKLNITWHVEDFCIIVSVAVGLFSKRLTATSRQNVSLWILAFLYLNDKKSVLVKSGFFFSKTGLAFLFLICVICLLCAIWVLFKIEIFSLCSEFLTDHCNA